MIAVVLVGAFCLGACLGSFGNVCIWRLPRPGLSPSRPIRSLCPRCGFLLPWYDNIPIASWLLLGGSCRRCGGSISARYACVEALAAGVVFALAWRLLCEESNPGAFVLWTALAGGMIVAAFIDLELMVLPDEVLLPALGLSPWLFLLSPGGMGPGEDGVGAALSLWIERSAGRLFPAGGALGSAGGELAAAVAGAALGVLVGEYARRKSIRKSPSRPFLEVGPFYLIGAAYGSCLAVAVADPSSLVEPARSAFLSSLAGAAAGAAAIGTIRFLGRYAFAQEAMGFGDVKLMALLGALVGAGGTLWAIILASILGSIVGIVRYAITRDRHLPFGPFLIGATGIVLCARPHLAAFLTWYGNLVSGVHIR